MGLGTAGVGEGGRVTAARSNLRVRVHHSHSRIVLVPSRVVRRSGQAAQMNIQT